MPAEIYALPTDQVYAALDSAPGGLSEAEARRRLARYGPNRIQEAPRTPLPIRFLANLYQPFALLLWVSAGLAFFSGSVELGWAIIAVIFLNAAFSFWQEFQAERALEALKRLFPARARVLREGEPREVLAEDLVPGDLLLLEAGDRVSADARVVEAFDLRADNSPLTGESYPVPRSADPVPPNRMSALEAPNLVFAGTTTVSGRGRAVAHATGMKTEFGRIASATQALGEQPSPLQREVRWVAYAIAALAVLAGLAFYLVGAELGRLEPRDSLVFAIGMIVANVPEGLLPTLTLALAVGVRRLAARRAIVKRLSAVEALGGVTAICTDKTGTLTQNEMTVRAAWLAGQTLEVSGVGYAPTGEFRLGGRAVAPPASGDLRLLLRAAALCNNARLVPPRLAFPPNPPTPTNLTPRPSSLPGKGETERDRRGTPPRAGEGLGERSGPVSPNLTPSPPSLPGKGETERDRRGTPPRAGEGLGERSVSASPLLPRWEIVGDPTEAALLVAARKAGLDLEAEAGATPRVFELPFDSVRKRMATVHQVDGRLAAYVKGAPREVLALCRRACWQGQVVELGEESRRSILAANDAFAAEALRVLAVAWRELPRGLDERDAAQVEQDLTFVGLLAMQDPPRPEVAEAIATGRRAGIRVIMITGDYGLTAEAVARRIGLVRGRPRTITGADLDRLDDQELRRVLAERELLFARVSPEHKLRIAAALQAMGERVAMTGDGVNDAPALKRADVGVAMGITGTDVAKEAAAILLADDNFATIVAAVEQGRVVFENIRKFIVYIFAHLGPEAVPFVAFALFRVPLAINAMQILAIDVGTETLPALALGLEAPEPGIMDRPPRPRKERLLTAPILLRAYLFLGLIESVFVMGGFFWVLARGGWSPGLALAANDPLYLQASTMAFLGIVATQVGTVFAARTERESVFRVGLLSNRWVLWGVAFELLVAAAIVYLPPLQAIFGTAALGPAEWAVAATFGPAVLLAEEARKWLARRKG
ncbi:MAG: cation-transporting P-type ATPase [Chloroflexi bacterium]|nr:cation-transporting P-type ATPase [Chloroflexota bacterium]